MRNIKTNTCYDAKQFSAVDEGLDTVAGSIDHDYKNEDGGHEDVALLSSTGLYEGWCFLLNCVED